MDKETLAARLNSRPECTHNKNWKDFLLEHPWYPKRFLVAHFGIKNFDLDNWKRSHPNVVVRLKNPKENFHEASTPVEMKESLGKAWRFLFDEVLKIDFNAKESVRDILSLSGIGKSPWAFLCDARLYKKFGEYEDWLSEGYTQLAFVVCKVYPGERWVEENEILPAMFTQSGKTFTRLELIEFLEKIYLRHLCNLSPQSSSDDIRKAKDRFFRRADENGFVTSAQIAPYGLTGHVTKTHGLRSIISGLKEKFAAELGETQSNRKGWSAGRFTKENPHRVLDRCHCCGRRPSDLHHLLSRESYPELIFHSENVMPLCAQVHAAISRGKISKNAKNALDAATLAWKKEKSGNKMKAFDKVMRDLHDEIYVTR